MDEAQRICDECGEVAEFDEEIEAVEEMEVLEEDTAEEGEGYAEDEDPEVEIEIEVDMDPVENEKTLGFRWYKFISCFALYAVAIVSVLLGLSAKSNGDYYSELFSYYVSESMGVFFGILGNFLFLLSAAAGLLAIATGILLIMKKAVGVKLNYICIGAVSIVLSFGNAMTGIALLFTGSATLSSVIVSAVNYLVIGGMLIALNKVYFDKRRELFEI